MTKYVMPEEISVVRTDGGSTVLISFNHRIQPFNFTVRSDDASNLFDLLHGLRKSMSKPIYLETRYGSVGVNIACGGKTVEFRAYDSNGNRIKQVELYRLEKSSTDQFGLLLAQSLAIRSSGGKSMASMPFEIKEDMGSTHPINIYFDPDLSFQVTTRDAGNIADCIWNLNPRYLNIIAGNCQLRLEVLSGSIFKMIDQDSGRVFQLSAIEAIELSALLSNSVANFNQVQSVPVSSSAVNVAHNPLFSIKRMPSATNPVQIYFDPGLWFDISFDHANDLINFLGDINASYVALDAIHCAFQVQRLSQCVSFLNLNTRRTFALSFAESVSMETDLLKVVHEIKQSAYVGLALPTLPSSQTTSKVFEIVESPGTPYPIRIFFDQKFYFDLTLAVTRKVADFLSAKKPGSFNFDSAQGRGSTSISSSGQFDFLNKNKHTGSILSKQDGHDLLIALRTAIVKINASNRQKSPNAQSAKTSYTVKFHDHGRYPLCIMIMIDNHQTFFHVRHEEVTDLIYCLSTQDVSMNLVTSTGDYNICWLFHDSIQIKHTGTFVKILIKDHVALKLAETIKSKMPVGFKSNSITEEKVQDVDTDPFAGAKKRTDDNLRLMFG